MAELTRGHRLIYKNRKLETSCYPQSNARFFPLAEALAIPCRNNSANALVRNKERTTNRVLVYSFRFVRQILNFSMYKKVDSHNLSSSAYSCCRIKMLRMISVVNSTRKNNKCFPSASAINSCCGQQNGRPSVSFETCKGANGFL